MRRVKRKASGMRRLTWFLPTSCGSACWEKKVVTTTNLPLSQSDQIYWSGFILASRIKELKTLRKSDMQE